VGSFRAAGEELLHESMVLMGLHKLSSKSDLKSSGAGEATGATGTLGCKAVGSAIVVQSEEAADLIEWLGKQGVETSASLALRKLAGYVWARVWRGRRR
jgi:hypothetical protein